MHRLLFIGLLLCPLLSWAGPAAPLTTIELQGRSAEELIPVIRPLLAPDDGISGRGNLLFLRADSDTVTQVRQLLDQIDRPLQNLLITVRTGEDMSRENARLGIEGHIDITEPSESALRAEASKRYQTGSRGTTQQLRVLEGQLAYITIGQSIPYPSGSVGHTPYGPYTHYSLQYRDTHNGFLVLPRLQGDRVTLEINPQREQLSRQGGGKIDTVGIHTMISGVLGEWIRLGGITEQTDGQASGILSTGAKRSEQDAEIWVRVTRIR